MYIVIVNTLVHRISLIETSFHITTSFHEKITVLPFCGVLRERSGNVAGVLWSVAGAMRGYVVGVLWSVAGMLWECCGVLRECCGSVSVMFRECSESVAEVVNRLWWTVDRTLQRSRPERNLRVVSHYIWTSWKCDNYQHLRVILERMK